MLLREPIEWSEALETGVSQIDREHRVLVDILNHAVLKLSANPHDPLFEQLTSDLVDYADYHFKNEEALIKQHGYDLTHADDASQHAEQHRGFAAQVAAMQRDTRLGQEPSRDALVAFLRNWLINHIMTIDKRLGQFIVTRTTAAP
jgi:hemerythrin